MRIDINVLIALLSGGVTLCVCLINNHFQNERTREEASAHYEKTNALIEYKLDELTKKVEKHNSVIERTFQLEKEIDIIEERQRDGLKRLSEVERER